MQDRHEIPENDWCETGGHTSERDCLCFPDVVVPCPECYNRYVDWCGSCGLIRYLTLARAKQLGVVVGSMAHPILVFHRRIFTGGGVVPAPREPDLSEFLAVARARRERRRRQA